MTRTRNSSPFRAWLMAWSLCLAALLLFRLFVTQAYGEPYFSPGACLLLALLFYASLLVMDPPLLKPGAALPLIWMALGAALLLAGQQLFWLRVADKRLLLAQGLALLGLGALCFIKPLLGRSSALKAPEKAPGLSLKKEWVLFSAALALAAGLRLWRLGQLPTTWWFDEVNLARAIQEHILAGEAPAYLGEYVENPGAYLMVGGVAFHFLGVSIGVLRALSAGFGWLALFPFYFLARRWMGSVWALVALTLFLGMRWVLIPQRVAFMSGFALFLALSAFYFAWRALSSRRALDWALAGFSLGATLHAYTPSRFALPLVLLFALFQWRSLKGVLAWRQGLAFAAAWLLAACPILFYAATHWQEYMLRAGQVSILNDIQARGLGELWVSLAKHLLMFNFQGDLQARHNLSGWPQLDFLSAAFFVPALFLVHARAWQDGRARFMLLWFWIMLAQGIFTMTVEAPQAHRSILVAPMVALALAWMAMQAAAVWGRALGRAAAARKTMLGVCLVALAAVPAFNAAELFVHWARDPVTRRSFSPAATGTARRAALALKGYRVYLSHPEGEHAYYSLERRFFTGFLLKQQGRPFYSMEASNPVRDGLGVLVIWTEAEEDVTAAIALEFPRARIEKAADPQSGRSDYLAAEIPIQDIPFADPTSMRRPLFFRP